MSHTGPLWWHHTVVEAFPLCRLADLCLRDTTPSLHPHSAHILANSYLQLSTGNFSRGLWSVHSWLLSQHAHTLLLPLRISHGGPHLVMTFRTVCIGDFGATCNFLSWVTDTGFIFFSPYFCHVPPPSLPSKSRLEPVKGLMRLEFIRQWVGIAPCSPLTADCWLSFWGNKTLVLFCAATCVYFSGYHYVFLHTYLIEVGFMFMNVVFQCQLVNLIFKCRGENIPWSIGQWERHLDSMVVCLT